LKTTAYGLQSMGDMAKTTPALATPLRDQLDKLAAIEPQDAPVLSLYLNLAADQHGRDSFDPFIRKAVSEHQKAFGESSAERESFNRDVERIHEYLSVEVNRSANAVAIFACSAANLFEAVQLQAPVQEHWLFVGAVPHVYPLAQLADRYPRYAAVVLDTNRAQIVVFALGAVERREQITGVKTRRNSMGGWSQARYQRRAENFHLHHVKEVVDTLDKIVSAENIPHIVIAGDEVVVPLVKEQLPQRLIDKLVNMIHLEKDVPDAELLRATLETLHEKDAENDIEAVQNVVGAWQAGGLGVVGPEATLNALTLGQVDELLITATPDALKVPQSLPEPPVAGEQIAAATSAPAGADDDRLKLAAELVNRAHQTSARVRFIEDGELLKDFGGVAASLRFRV
jgi:peptide subunit release factor 1 (eRF1)